MDFPITYGVDLIPWSGMPGMELVIEDRTLTMTGVFTTGKHVGVTLAEVNSHVLAFQFERLVAAGAPPAILQVVWDYGLARLTMDRIMKGGEGNMLLDIWCQIRQRSVDPGAHFMERIAPDRPEPRTVGLRLAEWYCAMVDASRDPSDWIEN